MEEDNNRRQEEEAEEDPRFVSLLDSANGQFHLSNLSEKT